jgi:hypothetical protein
MGTWSFPGLKSGRGVTLTPHPFLVPWSWKGRAIPLLSLRTFVAYEKGETYLPTYLPEDGRIRWKRVVVLPQVCISLYLIIVRFLVYMFYLDVICFYRKFGRVWLVTCASHVVANPHPRRRILVHDGIRELSLCPNLFFSEVSQQVTGAPIRILWLLWSRQGHANVANLSVSWMAKRRHRRSLVQTRNSSNVRAASP